MCDKNSLNLMYENIDYLIDKQNLKVTELEKKSGVSNGYIKKSYKNGSAVSLINIMNIADVLNVNLSTLLFVDLHKTNATADYIVQFIEKLIADTETNAIEWNKKDDNYFELPFAENTTLCLRGNQEETTLCCRNSSEETLLADSKTQPALISQLLLAVEHNSVRPKIEQFALEAIEQYMGTASKKKSRKRRARKAVEKKEVKNDSAKPVELKDNSSELKATNNEQGNVESTQANDIPADKDGDEKASKESICESVEDDEPAESAKITDMNEKESDVTDATDAEDMDVNVGTDDNLDDASIEQESIFD